MKDFRQLKVHFIYGFERSGTTLLSQFLNAHPEIISPPENLFLLQFYPFFKTKTNWTEDDIDFFIENIHWEGLKSLSLWGINKEQLKKELCAELPEFAYADLYKKVHSLFFPVGKKNNVQITIDKNNPFAFHAEKTKEIFPESKSIILVRDYRDVYLSRKNQGVFYQSNNPEVSGLLWSKVNRKLLHTLNDYHLVKYEDLILHPEDTLLELCKYLDIEFSSQMFEYREYLDKMVKKTKTSSDEKMLKKIGSSLFKPIDRKKVNAWEGKLNKEEIETLDYICNSTASELGYITKYKTNSIKRTFRDHLKRLHYQIVFSTLITHQFSRLFNSKIFKRYVHK